MMATKAEAEAYKREPASVIPGIAIVRASIPVAVAAAIVAATVIATIVGIAIVAVRVAPMMVVAAMPVTIVMTMTMPIVAVCRTIDQVHRGGRLLQVCTKCS
jgi:hypothetical protein